MDTQVDKLILESLEQLRQSVNTAKTDIAVLRNDLDQQKDDVKSGLEHLKKEAFPGGDTAGHRVYHENEMDKRRNTVDIKREVTAHILKGVFWAILVGSFWAIAASLKEWIKK